MKPSISFRSLLPVIGLLASMLLTACAVTPSAVPASDSASVTEPPTTTSVNNINLTSVDNEGSTIIDETALSNALDSIATSELSDDEIDGLLFMREEEKLAHDVYLVLYEQWAIPNFQNISEAELSHTAAVKTLLDHYELQDPAAGAPVGVFVNATLQGLYDHLVAEGSQSLASALKVGAAIEEIDIQDLEIRIAQTENPDIQLLYENLTRGSRNHLRAFTSTLERQVGETYQPQYLDQAAYDAIVNNPTERGRGSAGAQRGNGQGRRSN